MHLIQINASYKPAYVYGGPTMSVSKLSEELMRAGHSVRVLSTTANGATELNYPTASPVTIDGVPVHFYKRYTKDHSHFSPGLLLGLYQMVKNNPDTRIIHIHAWWNLVSVLSCFVALLMGKEVILSPRGTLSAYSFGNRKSVLKNLFHKLIGKALLKRCHIHATSIREEEAVIRLFHPQSIRVIPNFVELPQRTPACQDDGHAGFNVLFLSRIEEKKGLDMLFEALADCAFNWKLSIAGRGNEEYEWKLKQLAKSLKIDDRIIWIGQQGPERKFEVMQQHDLLVLPSQDENFANVVIESLAVGTPVLISQQVGLADYVAEKNLGWVSALDVKALSSALSNAFAQTAMRKTIRQTAPDIIRHDFNEYTLIKRYQDMYTDVTEHQSVELITANV